MHYSKTQKAPALSVFVVGRKPIRLIVFASRPKDRQIR
jgi:hypothetical protein